MPLFVSIIIQIVIQSTLLTSRNYVLTEWNIIEINVFGVKYTE